MIGAGSNDRRARFDPGELGHPAAVVLAGGVAMAALVARFFVPSALWMDEALSVNIAKLPLGQITDALRHDGHPPLYYLLLHGWMSIFGEGDRAVRALSGLISLLALPLAYRVGRRVGGDDHGPRLGAMTVIVLASSPFFLRYGSETRMYSLLIVLVFAGHLLVFESLESPRVHRLVGVAAVTGALLWTHYWSMWFLLAVGLLVAGRAWRSRRTTGDWDRPTLAVLVAMGAGAATFLPWVTTLAYQAAHTGTPWAKPFRPATLVIGSVTDFAGGTYSGAQVLMLFTVILVTLGIFGRGIDAWHVELDFHTQPESRVPATVMITTMAVASLAGLITGSAFTPRYAAVFFPFFVLLVALGLDHFRGAIIRNVALVVFILLSAASLASVFHQSRTQAREVADAIVADLGGGGGALAATCPDQLGPAVRREVPQSIEVTTYPRFDPPERVDWVDYRERNLHNDPAAFAAELSTRAGTRTIYLVLNNSYLTLGNQCAEVLSNLARSRSPRLVVAGDADNHLEPMTLYALEPRP